MSSHSYSSSFSSLSSSFSSSSPHTDSLTPPNPRPPNSRPPPPGPPCGSGLHFIIPIRADPVQDPQCWVTILQILLAKFKQKNCFEEKKKIIYLFLKLNLSCLSICLTMFILDKILMNGCNFEPTEHLVKQQQPVATGSGSRKKVRQQLSATYPFGPSRKPYPLLPQ